MEWNGGGGMDRGVAGGGVFDHGGLGKEGPAAAWREEELAACCQCSSRHNEEEKGRGEADRGTPPSEF